MIMFLFKFLFKKKKIKGRGVITLKFNENCQHVRKWTLVSGALGTASTLGKRNPGN